MVSANIYLELNIYQDLVSASVNMNILIILPQIIQINKEIK